MCTYFHVKIRCEIAFIHVRNTQHKHIYSGCLYLSSDYHLTVKQDKVYEISNKCYMNATQHNPLITDD